MGSSWLAASFLLSYSLTPTPQQDKGNKQYGKPQES